MEARLSKLFVSQGWYGQRLGYIHMNTLRFCPPYRFNPACCKMRQRNFSSQGKKQQVKKIYPGSPTNANFQPNGDEESSAESSSDQNASSSHHNFENDIETLVEAEREDSSAGSSSKQNASRLHLDFENDLETLAKAEHEESSSDKQNASGSLYGLKDDLETLVEAERVGSSAENSSEENASSSHHDLENDLESLVEAKLEDSSAENSFKQNVSSLHHDFENDLETIVEAEHEDGNLGADLQISSLEDTQIVHQDFGSDVRSPEKDEHAVETEMSSLLNDITSLSINGEGGKQESGVQPQDMIGMIRNAEKNIHLLNQARVRALEDLERVFGEKEALQGEISNLEKRLAETDARIRVAAQEKINVELLEDQLEKLRKELSSRSSLEFNIHDVQNSAASLNNKSNESLNKELDLLRMENMSLKNDVQELKAELSAIKGTGKRIQMLEKERADLSATLTYLELKLAASQEDVLKLSPLRSECKSLYEKVEHLQTLLDKATKQADQATVALQQNQELLGKVDRLEKSLEEANVYKLSSERLQQYNELMQQKIKLLDEHLQRSDEEILSHVQLYQDSVKDFQETLDNLKEESRKRALNQPVDDMPWEFWSRLLLMIDAWFLEKKISEDDAKLLRGLVWKRDRRIYDVYMSSRGKGEREILALFLGLTMSSTSAGLHVIHIAAEMAPVAKVGGLGDVVTGLGKALQKKGHLVEVILPKYDCVQYELVNDLRALDVAVESYFDGQLFKNKVWLGTVEGLPVYFIEPQHPGKFFHRGQIYGEHDDFKRFSFFSRAALELILQSGKRPDIIHSHDWQTAFVGPLYWDIYAPKGLNSARICFTCHNFEYQGTAPASELASCGLDVYHLNRPDRMQDNSADDRVNPVKGAIVFSNIVTTVSPTYAQEARTSEGGRGLHATLNSHSKKFIGILNGIDTDAWSPATDPYLKVQYNENDVGGKVENKEALRSRLGLSSADTRRPLVCSITRLVPQKGVHLIRHAIYRTLELGGQFVLLGSSPVPHIQREFEDIANHFQSHDHIRLILKYDESLARLIYAASDMFIIPSIFEPCGLTQMIAMRYGSIPVTRKTGGLNDSVFDVDDDNVPVQFRNGYTFFSADEQGFNSAIERAFKHYNNNSESWKALVKKVMSMDFSWETSALIYEELYTKAVARARATNRT